MNTEDDKMSHNCQLRASVNFTTMKIFLLFNDKIQLC